MERIVKWLAKTKYTIFCFEWEVKKNSFESEGENYVIVTRKKLRNLYGLPKLMDDVI